METTHYNITPKFHRPAGPYKLFEEFVCQELMSASSPAVKRRTFTQEAFLWEKRPVLSWQLRRWHNSLSHPFLTGTFSSTIVQQIKIHLHPPLFWGGKGWLGSLARKQVSYFFRYLWEQKFRLIMTILWFACDALFSRAATSKCIQPLVCLSFLWIKENRVKPKCSPSKKTFLYEKCC